MLRVLILALTCGIAASCGGGEPEPDNPREEPYMTGVIESMMHRATSSSLLVRSIDPTDDPCGIAAVVDAQTSFYRRPTSGPLVEAALSDLGMGDTVELYVSGPVAESCPLQGRADRVVLISRSGGPTGAGAPR